MKTGDLLEALRAHYLKPGELRPGGIFVHEVSINGEWQAGRRCDAIYIGFTNAGGREMVGHELKVSRSDWLHELNDPTKSEKWSSACHRWYIVAPDIEVVRPDELPHGWGLLVPKARGRRLQYAVKADGKPDGFTPPWRAVQSVMARYDTLRADALARARMDAEDRARKEANERWRAEAEHNAMTPEARAAVGIVEAFKEHGVELSEFVFRRGDVLGPKDIADLMPTIIKARSVKSIKAQLAVRLPSLSRIEECTLELRRVVEEFRQVIDEESPCK